MNNHSNLHIHCIVRHFYNDICYRMTSYDLLDKVDNYGLLNLDIVWCYLHLKSVHYLSDAEKRLQICDETFRKCYGPNLERVKALKGTSGIVDEFSIVILSYL